MKKEYTDKPKDEITDSIRILTPEDIAKIPPEEYEAIDAMPRRIVTRRHGERVGIAQLEPGAVQPASTFPNLYRCFYILNGSVFLDDHELPAGSFGEIPPGVNSGVTKGGPRGGTMLYVVVGVAQTEDNLAHDQLNHTP